MRISSHNSIIGPFQIQFSDAEFRSSQKKKKKDRERDRDRDRHRDRDRDRDGKDKVHRHKTDKGRSSSKSSAPSESKSSNNSASLNVKVVSNSSDSEVKRSSGNQNLGDKEKVDGGRATSSSLCSIKPTSSTNQSNQIDHNGKHALNESASCKELNGNSGSTTTTTTSDLSHPSDEVNNKVQQGTIVGDEQQSTSCLNNSDELNNVPDTTTTEIESNGQKLSPIPVTGKTIILPKSDRKVFVSANIGFPSERKPTEVVGGIVIKKDYLPPPAKLIKVEKTRDDVARVLNYDAEPNSVRSINAGTAISGSDSKAADEKIKIDALETPIKTEPPENRFADTENSAKKSITISHISENKENALHKTETVKSSKERTEDGADASAKLKLDYKSRENSSEKKEHRSSSSEHRHQHSSKSASSKSSTHRSSSSHDCSRCYRRSKIKRANVGIQCCKFGEPFKQMTPTSTPMKSAQTLACNMNDSIYTDLKYGRFFHVEVHTNGGASIVHMYQNEIDTLNETEMDELTEEFFRVVFSEDDNGSAHHVMGIVHNAASYIPDLLEHMADNYSTLTVKAGVLGRNSDIETSTLAQYYEQVAKNYSHGTFRYGPLHQISLVGKVHEEVGGYFPDLLGRLESSLFLKKVISVDKQVCEGSFFSFSFGINRIFVHL